MKFLVNGRFWLTGMLCAATMPAIGAHVRIELHGSVGVGGPLVTLGQVAHITSTDLAALRRLLALPLGATPAPDTAVTLTRATLARWLRVRGAQAGHDIEWRGEEQVSVYGLDPHAKPADRREIAPAPPASVASDTRAATEALTTRGPGREGPAVQRGAWATLRLFNGSLALENKVEVLHDAWIGQRVRVRTAQADSTLLVRVIGRGQLELQP